MSSMDNIDPATLSDGILDAFITELAAASNVAHPREPKAQRLVALRREKLRRTFEASLQATERSNVLLAGLTTVSIS